MNFINNLVESAGSVRMKEALKETPMSSSYDNGGFRVFEPIQIGDVYISIQASYGHYCSPRKTLENLNDYTSMEVALIRDDHFVSISEVIDEQFLSDKLSEHFEGTVYSYVPVELIEEVYLYLAKKRSV